MINKRLAKERGLSDSEVDVIETLTKDLNSVLKRPLYYFNSYKYAVHYVESTEIVLQRLWRFDYNPNYQTYRFSFKECTCPSLDNYDRIGTGSWIYKEDCPVHKHLLKK